MAATEREREILFDLSNTPIIYFACCDEDEKIPKEANEEERGGEGLGGNWRRRVGKNMGAKNECGTDGGDEDVMNRGSIAVVNLRSFFVDARTKDVCHCTALPCILQCFC